jgi:glycosyltransferase involved in cell wall biosynthesis
MFGFLGGNRGIDTVLGALAALPERDNFHLDIYGDLPDADRWAREIHAAGLGAHVSLHGYVPAATFAAALDGAHLALNLRQPARGEASFSLLQAWNHGLPTIVSRGGWFDEIPSSCAGFVRLHHARDDLIRHLQALPADPEHYRTLGLAGHERLRRLHAPAPYATRLARFAAYAAAHRGRANALQMADRAAAALHAVAGRHVDEWALERIGSAILALTEDRRSR